MRRIWRDVYDCTCEPGTNNCCSGIEYYYNDSLYGWPMPPGRRVMSLAGEKIGQYGAPTLVIFLKKAMILMICLSFFCIYIIFI